MKTKFMYVGVAALMLAGLNSCSNDDKTAVDNGKPVDITVRVSTPTTYADEPSAAGNTPTFHDAYVFFTDGTTVLYADVMATASETFIGVSTMANKVIVIGNAANLSSPTGIAAIAAGDPESDIDALMFQQSVQTTVTITGDEVNLYGAVTFTPGATTVAVSLDPAISRIEIAQVSANASALIPLTAFDLQGIYINNTYMELGTDYTTLPTVISGLRMLYPAADPVWAGPYPAGFHDVFTTFIGGTSYSAANYWSYYVMPVAAGDIKTIDSFSFNSVPIITLKIGNAISASTTFPATTYVNISEIITSGITPITHLEKGKAYQISSIAIGGENLSPLPVIPPTVTLTVNATVNAWIGEPSTPVIP